MHRQLLICSVILGSSLVTGITFGQNPTHVCPQWEWGQTGEIHHYYSEYCEESDDVCNSLGWDNYDGAANLAMNVGCPDCDRCLATLVTSQTKPTSEQGKKGKANAQKTDRGRRPQTAPGLARNGLTNLPAAGHRPTLMPGATLRDTLTADVESTSEKTIRVNLFIILLDPQGHIPKGDPIAHAPALVANGVEVRSQGRAEITIPNRNVERLDANAFDITVGQIVYRVITHEEEE